MDIIRVQILAGNSEEDKRKAMVEKLQAVSYIRIEERISEGEDLIDAFKSDRSDVVLIFEHFNGNGYISSKEVTSNYPTKSTLMVKSDSSKINIREVVRSGASDIITYNVDIQTITDVIYSTHTANLDKQEMLRSEKESLKQQEGRVLTVFSTKGGSGKTFLASNLAVSIASQNKGRVVILDLDSDYGGIDLAMNLNVETTISDAVDDIQHIDSDLMESYLTKYSKDVFVLAGSCNPNLGEYLNSEQVEIIINTLKLSFDYIIVDMPARFMESINPAFTLATTVFLVTTPEVLTLRNTRSALLVFDDLGYPMERVKVILNKMAFGGISRRDVEKTLGRSVFEEIPDDSKRVIRSQNEGKPFILTHPRRPISRSINKIVENAVG